MTVLSTLFNGFDLKDHLTIYSNWSKRFAMTKDDQGAHAPVFATVASSGRDSIWAYASDSY